jgi:hypothetical protein
VSGAAVDRYSAEWLDSIAAWTIEPLPHGNSVELVLASAHDAAIAAIAAKLQQCREALEAALPRMTHRVQCYRCRPTEEWEQHGSASFDGCECEIRQVRAALKEGA